MSRICKFLLPLSLVCLFSACGQISTDSISQTIQQSSSQNRIVDMISGKKDTLQTNEGGMEVIKTVFAPDYKTFYVNVRMTKDIGINLTDSTEAFIEAYEIENDLLKYESGSQPKLTSVKNIKADELSDLEMHMLVLVDLTLSEEAIARQKDIVSDLRTWFKPENLHVAFMHDNTVSQSVLATDYVMDTYFKQSKSSKLLYRSIFCKQDEVNGKKSKYFPNVPQDTIWRHLKEDQRSLLVLSDDKVYDSNNRPLDNMHFDFQQQIINWEDTIDGTAIYYIDLNAEENPLASDSNLPIIKLMCQKSLGEYFEKYEFKKLLGDMLYYFGTTTDYQFNFTNPDNKVYRGKPCTLAIKCYDEKGELLASTQAKYTLGSIYDPVIVNGTSILQTIIDGVLYCLVLILLVWLFGQIIIPFFKYLYFKHKYVVSYTGPNMTANGILIDSSCYYCKEPFKEGDKLVAKCEHVMHQHCWDENKYKCPEYGPHCKKGLWYYNHKNILDFKNASFYMKWILAGIFAGIFAWILFLGGMSTGNMGILDGLLLHIYNLQPGSAEAGAAIQHYGYHLHYLPLFGASICFALTLFLSLLSERPHLKLKFCISVLSRALVAGILGYLAFLLGCIISISLKITENTFLVDWIPWVLSGIIIAFCTTFRTGIRIRIKFVILAVLIGLISMYAWSLSFFYINVNSLELMLISNLLYTIGMALSIATVAPKSAHYFLKITGPVKETDVALYKWMSSSPDFRVTIGKSVDCNLQLTWDITSDIAPIEAEIVSRGDQLYVVAIENGVYVSGKHLKPGGKRVLYHGRKFTIGKTTFTYVEKDS